MANEKEAVSDTLEESAAPKADESGERPEEVSDDGTSRLADADGGMPREAPGELKLPKPAADEIVELELPPGQEVTIDADLNEIASSEVIGSEIRITFADGGILILHHNGLGLSGEGPERVILSDGIYDFAQDSTLTVQRSEPETDIGLLATRNNSPTIEDAALSVDENAAVGTAVGAPVTGSDLDGDPLSYSIASGNDDGIFEIDEATGQIRIADNTNLDYEKATTHSLTVEASDGTSTDTATVTVNVGNLNDNSPVIDDRALSVDENSADGTNIGAPVAGSDADGDVLSYSIASGNEAGIFEIDEATGQIRIADNTNLDYESATSHSLTVEASDGTFTDRATVTVNVGNLNDNTPTIGDAAFSVAENAADGTTLGAPVAGSDGDGDVLSYSIASGNDDGIFEIDEVTGQIRIADNTNLDYEKASSHSLTVEASDGTFTDRAAVTVNVGNFNDNDPVLVDRTVSVDENAADGTSVGSPITGTDGDGDVLSYSIASGNDDGIFEIDGATGQIRIADYTSLDYEKATSHNLIVKASDGTRTDTATVTVNVGNLNEAPTYPDATFTVDENSLNGTVVGTAAASDPDTADTLSYSIVAGDPGGTFSIDSGGQITVSDGSLLDFETPPTFTLTVEARDGGTGNLADTATVTVNLNDLNEAPIDLALSVSSIDENTDTSGGSMKVADITVTDDALGANTLTLAGADAASFEIVGSELHVRQGVVLDFESKPSHDLTITATDGGLIYSEAFTVTVNDVNEAPTDLSLSATTIDENTDTSGGSIKVADITVTDDALGANTLTLAGADAASFEIVGSELHVRQSVVLDFESKPSYDLTITSTDGGLNYSEDFTINLNDLNEGDGKIHVIGDSTLSESLTPGEADIIVWDGPYKAGSLSDFEKGLDKIDLLYSAIHLNPIITSRIIAADGGFYFGTTNTWTSTIPVGYFFGLTVNHLEQTLGYFSTTTQPKLLMAKDLPSDLTLSDFIFS